MKEVIFELDGKKLVRRLKSVAKGLGEADKIRKMVKKWL